ncbi:MAG: glycosyltransferase family 9 protein [Candidatus Schekmanbacteria bacterium]|nr:glycosyltransferase family 9 protein [Candidatus Schekmanbacteria bacterium]
MTKTGNNYSAKSRILIVRLGSLGDIIHTLPSLHAIRKAMPSSQIFWVVESRSSAILKDCPLINGIIEIDTKKWRNKFIIPTQAIPTILEIISAIRELRNKKFDWAIDFQGLIKSGLITFLSGAKDSVGFTKENLREPLSSIFVKRHISPSANDRHVIQKNLALLSGLGIKPDADGFRLKLEDIGAESNKKNILSKFNMAEKGKTIAGIYPGAGWATKLWGAENYSSLANMINEKLGMKVAIIGGKGEEHLVESVARKISPAPLCITGTSIKELAIILNNLGIFIGGDTGPLHLADALGTPTVGIFGPSSPSRNGPFWGTSRTVQADIPCKDCYKRSCDHLTCIRKISVELVFKAVEEVVKETGTNGKS